jgi:SPP1 family phage portal protein
MVNFYGREQIFTDETEITRENVLKVIANVGTIHTKNAMQITRLYDYYKGKQGIYERIKEIRPEICNKIVENWANAIVSFKVGYLCGSPIQYVSGKSGKDLTKSIDTLNDLMDSRGKSSIDKDLIEWQMIAGTSYRALFSDESEIVSMFSVDPRNAFVIYSNDIKKQPLAGVYVTEKKEKARNFTEYTVYTPTKIFVVKNKRVSEEQNSLNAIPIMEYPANNARLSVIEIVIDLLDAINEIDSNRLDGIEQFIQSLLVLYNADLDEGETGNTIREKGLIKLKSIGECKGDIKILSEQLDQSQTQTLKNDILQRIREIVGLPSQGDGTTGDSSNNGAMILKGGWENAETRARESEVMFKRSELPFLKLLFTILKTKGVVDLELSDVDIRFTRRNYENIQVKSQVLTTMLNNEKIHPKLAYESCGMFIDPEEAYNVSMEYYANNRRTEQPNDSNNTEPTANNGTDAEGNSTRFAT